MKQLKVKTRDNLNLDLKIPGDKSISHRTIILGSLSEGITEATNFLMSEDCLNTVKSFRQLGVKIDVLNTNKEKKVIVNGRGLFGLKNPEGKILDVGNSGTAIRLLLGVLAAQSFDTKITGDESICKRPMKRVVSPLTKMGAKITSLNGDDCYAPLLVKGNQKIKSIKYQMKIASAQVKSAIILAGLYAEGESEITEIGESRDHTEKMLNKFGAKIFVKNKTIKMQGQQVLTGQNFVIPSDISSAAFFLVAGCIVPNSKIILRDIGINSTRTGIVDVLKQMGANIEIKNIRQKDFEPIADIEVVSSNLKGIKVNGEIIPRIIDEIPIIAVAAAMAEGETVISDAQELRVKESDRISTTFSELYKFGIDIEEKEDGLIINGMKTAPVGAVCQSHGDHRIAMACAIMGLVSEGETVIDGTECINTSFPEFFDLIEKFV
jgi:3-phosphoshikimate 1-carboxyvinyltransferase